MAKMKNTEGAEIPQIDGHDLFNLRFSGDGQMAILLPSCAFGSEEYLARDGALTIPLREVFDESLVDGQYLFDSCGEATAVADLLRDYATKFDAVAELIASSKWSAPFVEEEHKTLVQEFKRAAVMTVREMTQAKNH